MANIIRTANEISQAHDLMIGALFVHATGGELALSEPQMLDVLAHAAVLCWLLGHPYNPAFEDHLKYVKKCLEQAGFGFLNNGGPIQ